MAQVRRRSSPPSPSPQRNNGLSLRNGTAAPRNAMTTITHAELVDLCAAQRTFDGAYMRTALGQLSYAIVVLRLFQPQFYYVGVAYTVLALYLLLVAVYRYRLAVTNEDRWTELPNIPIPPPQTQSYQNDFLQGSTTQHNGQLREGDGGNLNGLSPSDTRPSNRRAELVSLHSNGNHADVTTSANPRITATVLRRTFSTAGDVVVVATAGTLAVEVTLAVLLMRI